MYAQLHTLTIIGYIKMYNTKNEYTYYNLMDFFLCKKSIFIS